MVSPVVTRLLAAALVCASMAFAPAPAAAASHRARLSADLEDHLTAGSQIIRVIVHGTRADVDALAVRYNLEIAKYLQSGAVLQVNAGQLAAMRQDEAQDHLSGDIRIQSSVDAADLASIGADQVWAGSNDVKAQTGGGITVAVIDSGINRKHRAFANGRVLFTKDFTGGDGEDRYGHGTHVAAIIAGQAGTTVEQKDYRGIAAGAYLLNLRVLGDDGSGTVSDVIEAIDWTIAHKHEYNVRIINLSLGAPVLQPYRDDPLCEAVERAVRSGLVVVAAAGNYGKTKDGRSVYGAITSPANSPYAIAVGAIDTHNTAERSDDTLATYSSKGPTRYDLIMKPDLAAPGSHIKSAEATDSYLSTTYPARHVSGAGANAVMQLSGTSMAAGFVSGAAALVLDARGSLRPADTKAALQLTSTFMPSAGIVGAGAGMINVLAAVELAATNEIPSQTTIAGEQTVASQLFSTQVPAHHVPELLRMSANSRIRRGPHETPDGDTSTGGITSDGDDVYWDRPVSGSTIYWGVGANTIYWGVGASTIYWGVGASTIYWGVDASTIYWGVGADHAS